MIPKDQAILEYFLQLMEEEIRAEQNDPYHDLREAGVIRDEIDLDNVQAMKKESGESNGESDEPADAGSETSSP